MPEIEKEFKTSDKEQYDALVNDYKEVFTKDVTKTNSYTTMKGAKERKMALHIRIVEGKKPVKSHKDSSK